MPGATTGWLRWWWRNRASKQEPFRWGLAQADVSTGDVQVMQREGSDGLHQQLAQLEASELLWSGDDPAPAWCPDRVALTPMNSTPFSQPEAEAALLQHYNLASLDGLGLPELPLALQAIGGLLRYVRDTQPLDDHARVPLDVPAIVHSGETLVLDAQTRRNLELTATQRDGLLARVVALGDRPHPHRHGRPLPTTLDRSATHGSHGDRGTPNPGERARRSALAPPSPTKAASTHGGSGTARGPGRRRPCRCP